MDREQGYLQQAGPVEGDEREPEVRVMLQAQVEERVAREERGVGVLLEEGDMNGLVERAKVVADEGDGDEGGDQEQQVAAPGGAGKAVGKGSEHGQLRINGVAGEIITAPVALHP